MINRSIRISLSVFAVIVVSSVTSEAQAQFGQTLISGTPADNVASVSGRSPGRMVSSGIARTQGAINLSRSPVQITEPKRRDTIRANAFSQSLEGFLGQFNRILDELLDLLIVRAGGTPQTPSALSSGRR